MSAWSGNLYKCCHCSAAKLSAKKCAALNQMCGDQARLEATPVQDFMGLFAV